MTEEAPVKATRGKAKQVEEPQPAPVVEEKQTVVTMLQEMQAKKNAYFMPKREPPKQACIFGKN